MESLINVDAERLKQTRAGTEAAEAVELGVHGFFDMIELQQLASGLVELMSLGHAWDQILCASCNQSVPC
jgi:hypothetical protein